jgi:predicted RNA binding protein YcfA (HicA-like mRNA interferase family)
MPVTKLPRDITGPQFIKRIEQLGYRVVNQSGSHIICVTEEGGHHRIPVPNHHPIKPGMLSGLLLSIANHFGCSKAELRARLEL